MRVMFHINSLFEIKWEIWILRRYIWAKISVTCGFNQSSNFFQIKNHELNYNFVSKEINLKNVVKTIKFR